MPLRTSAQKVRVRPAPDGFRGGGAAFGRGGGRRTGGFATGGNLEMGGDAGRIAVDPGRASVEVEEAAGPDGAPDGVAGRVGVTGAGPPEALVGDPADGGLERNSAAGVAGGGEEAPAPVDGTVGGAAGGLSAHGFGGLGLAAGFFGL
jgi:hypothetical protein